MLKKHRTVPNTCRAISWSNIYIGREYRDIVDQIPNVNEGVYPLFATLFDEIVETIEVEIFATRFPEAISKNLKYS